MQDTDLAYAAGILDGEGSISIRNLRELLKLLREDFYERVSRTN
jgi:hypothetical protein